MLKITCYLLLMIDTKVCEDVLSGRAYCESDYQSLSYLNTGVLRNNGDSSEETSQENI